MPTVKPAIDWHYKEISAEQPERKMMAMGAVGVRFGDLLEGSMVQWVSGKGVREAKGKSGPKPTYLASGLKPLHTCLQWSSTDRPW